jgi:hypothetical protein
MRAARAVRWVAEIRMNRAVGDLAARQTRGRAATPDLPGALTPAAKCAERVDAGRLPDESLPPAEEHRLQHAPRLPANFGRPARTRKTALPAGLVSTSRRGVSCAYLYCLMSQRGLDRLLLA